MDLLTGMEFDLFVPGFTQIQNHFDLTAFAVEALLSANFIGYCISLFIVGDLADRYGRKPIILIGLMIFILGSIFCLIKSAYGFILFGRFLQGIGIAAPAILSFLIIADRYPLQRQQFLMAMLNGSLNLAVGIAPVLGSYITLYFHWQGNFAALLLLGTVVLIMTVIFIPRDHFLKTKTVSSLNGYQKLFQSKPLLLLILYIVIMSTPYWIFVGISPLLYMKNLHVTLYSFGFYQGILAFVFALGSILFGWIMNQQPQKFWLSIGIWITVAALCAVSWVTIAKIQNPLFITLAMLIFVIGQIIPATLLYPLSLNVMPEAKAKISAVTQAGRLMMSALSLQIVGYYYDGTFQSTGMIIALFIFMMIVLQYRIIKINIL